MQKIHARPAGRNMPAGDTGEISFKTVASVEIGPATRLEIRAGAQGTTRILSLRNAILGREGYCPAGDGAFVSLQNIPALIAALQQAGCAR